jgi:hypothetical protein
MHLIPRSTHLCIQLNSDQFNVMALQFVGAIMEMGWTQAQSHHLARFSDGFRPAFWKAMAHSSSRPPESWPPPADCLVFCLWLEFPWRSRPPAPSTHPPVHYCFWFWLDSCPSNNNYHALHLWFPVFFLMPRLRGKSKRGAGLVHCKRKRFERTRQEDSSKLASRLCACLHPRASPCFISRHLPGPPSRTGHYSRISSIVISLRL